MKNEIYNSLPVYKLTYQDWKKGKQHGILKSGYKLVKDKSTKGSYYIYLSDQDYLKIVNELKTGFPDRVDKYKTLITQLLNEKINKSQIPDEYIREYIERLDKEIKNDPLFQQVIKDGIINFEKLSRGQNINLLNEDPQVKLQGKFNLLLELERTLTEKKQMDTFKTSSTGGDNTLKVSEADLQKIVHEIINYQSYIKERTEYELEKYQALVTEKIKALNNEALEVYYHNKSLRNELTKEDCQSPYLKELIKAERLILDEIDKRQLEAIKELRSSRNNNQNKKPEKKKTSYVWQMNPDKELPELYSLMIYNYKLIASETTYDQFKAVFTGQPIDEIDKISRTKKFTNVLLTYFVSKLFQESNPNDYLSIAEGCFDGAKNLSQAQINYFNNKNSLPKNHRLIDDLIKDLRNPL